ncbi:MAG: hypothetical protein KDA85_06955, partial [Planctomycetaceae bacterium]|nr:hypothetical protein [Planctomycetaceae bacterium]
MDQLDQQILETLGADDYRPVVAQELARILGIRKKHREGFRDSLKRLADSNRIRIGKKGRIRLTADTGFISGVLRKISSGAAFVVPAERRPELQGGDIYISATDVRDAQTGDEVLVRLTSRRRSGGQRCGRIERILERASNVFVGTYLERGGQGFVRVDGTVFSDPIHVGDPGAKGAVPDDKFIIEML